MRKAVKGGRPFEGIADWSTNLSIPDLNGAVVRSGDDVPPIGRVNNGPHPGSVPLKGTANWSTSVGIPDSNGAVVGSGDDVPPIGRVSNGPHPGRVPLEGITDWSTCLSIPDSNGAVFGSNDVPAHRESKQQTAPRKCAPRGDRRLEHQSQHPRFEWCSLWIRR